MTTHSSILVWKISWTERSGRLQFMESPRVGHNWAQLSSSRSLGLSYEILASRKPLHSRQTGMVDHPLSPPKSSISISGTRLSQDSKSQNWPPVQTHPNTQEFLSLVWRCSFLYLLLLTAQGQLKPPWSHHPEPPGAPPFSHGSHFSFSHWSAGKPLEMKSLNGKSVTLWLNLVTQPGIQHLTIPLYFSSFL